MSRITIIWSAASGACLMLALMHLLVWCRDRRSWANFCFFAVVLGVIGLVVCEMTTMHTESPEVFGLAIRWTHLAYAIGVAGSLGFVHFYFGSGRRWLLVLALGLRSLAVVANFTTGASLHVSFVRSLQKMTFLGEQVSILGEWVANPWVRLGQFASLVQLAYVVDSSIRLWRTGSPASRKRAACVGGTLALFIVFTPLQAGLVAAGVLRMPFLVSFPFLGMLVVMGYELSRDVLRTRQLSDELREGEQRMSLAVDAANFGIWIRDFTRNEVWASDKWRELFGFGTSERLEFNWILQRVHPEDREAVREAQAQAIAAAGSYETEYRVVLPDGKTRWIASHGRVEVDAKGRPVRLRGASRDVTARKLAEEALRESEARFRAMADTAPVMIWMSGTDKLCTFFNQSWLDFTGRALEQETGNGWAAGVHPEDFDQCLKTYASSFDARRAFSMDYRLRKAGGEYRWILDHGVPRFASNGDFLGYIGSCIDITERRLAEEAAHDLSGRLIHAQEETQTRLARELHDDLSQSLALLSVELEMFGQNPPTEPQKIATRMEGFSTQVKRLSSEVHRLSYELHPAKLDQLGLVAAVRGFCKEFALAHEIAVEFTEHNVPRVVPDDAALCLYRIAQEALHNVVKHSGGTAAKVELTRGDGHLRLVVADDGTGFDPQTTRTNGSLGLVSMSERARFVGGRFSIESHPGAGTRVEVHVPIVAAEEPVPR